MVDNGTIIIYDNSMDVSELSRHIKRLRQKSGLSLSKLARRVNTSAPTISRYESGWDRFELYTLNKIASALGYRLDISLKPVHAVSPAKNPSKIIKKIKRLFWDHRLKKSDLEKYPTWVVERVIEYGDMEDIRLLINYFGKNAFLRHVANCRFGSPKTEKFWKVVLNKENIVCMKKPFPREARIY